MFDLWTDPLRLQFLSHSRKKNQSRLNDFVPPHAQDIMQKDLRPHYRKVAIETKQREQEKS